MRRAAWLLAALLLASGASAQDDGTEATGATETRPQRRSAQRGYKLALRRWTRELKLYQNFETKLLMRAVLKTEAFREAWSREYARLYMLPSEDYALLKEKQRDDAARFHEVIFAVWAADTKNGHFLGDDSPWSLQLVTADGRAVAPLVLTRIKRPSTELREMFPFITPHDRVFVAKFPVLGPDGTPLASTGAPLRLRVAGVLARGEMVWELAR